MRHTTLETGGRDSAKTGEGGWASWTAQALFAWTRTHDEPGKSGTFGYIAAGLLCADVSFTHRALARFWAVGAKASHGNNRLLDACFRVFARCAKKKIFNSFTSFSRWKWFNLFFFFFFLSFRKCCLTRQWQRTECDTRYMVQQKKFDVILRFLVDRYRRTKPPKPDASQVLSCSSATSKTGNRFRWSFFFAVWRRCARSQLHMNIVPSFSWRVKEAALWFESYSSKNLTGGTTWSSQSTSTDWLTRTHYWSSPRSKLANKKPTSTRKLRKFPVTSGQGSKHRDWTVSRWWRSHFTVIVVSASCHHFTRADSGWSRISWFSRVTLPWLRGGTSVAPWRHKCSHVPVFRRLFLECLTVFPFEFRPRTFTIRFYGKKLYHIRAYDFGVQFSFKDVHVAVNLLSAEQIDFSAEQLHCLSNLFSPLLNVLAFYFLFYLLPFICEGVLHLGLFWEGCLFSDGRKNGRSTFVLR